MLFPFFMRAVLLSFTVFCLQAAPADLYTYKFSESLPCDADTCTGNINLSGSIITDGLGALEASDIVAWDLSIGQGTQTSVELLQTNSGFSTIGSVQIVATKSNLVMTRNTSSDGFLFSGTSSAPASWIYGISPGGSGNSLELLSYNPNAKDQYSAQQPLSSPSTFTAVAPVSAAEIPEPASFLLIATVGLIWLMVRNRHFGGLLRHEATRDRTPCFSNLSTSELLRFSDQPGSFQRDS